MNSTTLHLFLLIRLLTGQPIQFRSKLQEVLLRLLCDHPQRHVAGDRSSGLPKDRQKSTLVLVEATIRGTLAVLRTEHNVRALWTANRNGNSLEARAAVSFAVFLQQYGYVRLFHQYDRVRLQVYVRLCKATLLTTVIEVKPLFGVELRNGWLFWFRRDWLAAFGQFLLGFDVLWQQVDHDLGITFELLATLQGKFAVIESR